jgi:SAM-dependent methyltransferase
MDIRKLTTVRRADWLSRLAAPGKTTAPPPLEDSLGRIPPGTRVFDRFDYLVERARGRSVIHLGFVDARNMMEKVDRSMWLHDKLGRVAGQLVGIDADAKGVGIARSLGYQTAAADCQSYESVAAARVDPAALVIAGEIIEHLDKPGDFLSAVKQLIAADGELVITTPNPTSLTNAILALMGREVQNADHVGWQSWRTLEALLGRHGFALTELAYYRHPKYVPAANDPLTSRIRCRTFNAYQTLAWPLLAIAPSLADGLIVVARPDQWDVDSA